MWIADAWAADWLVVKEEDCKHVPTDKSVIPGCHRAGVHDRGDQPHNK